MQKLVFILFIFVIGLCFSSCSKLQSNADKLPSNTDKLPSNTDKLPSNTDKTTINDSYKTFTNSLFKFSVPSDWDISVDGSEYSIKENEKVVGEIFEENIPSKIEDILFSLSPSLGEVYYSKVLKDLFAEAAIFKYKRSYNEGDIRVTKDMTEIGFVINKEDGHAVKFVVETNFTDEETLMKVAKTFNYANK